MNHIVEQQPKIENNTIIGNNNNIVKQKFNLNIFLNETCKDAMSIDDFVNSIEITMDDLETVTNKGLAFSISKLIVDNMNKLPVIERPMHCTDSRRETIYVKNEIWEKDIDKNHLNTAIRKINKKQICGIGDIWQSTYPKYLDNTHQTNQYVKMTNKITDPLESSYSKVLRNICDKFQVRDKDMDNGDDNFVPLKK